MSDYINYPHFAGRRDVVGYSGSTVMSMMRGPVQRELPTGEELEAGRKLLADRCSLQN